MQVSSSINLVCCTTLIYLQNDIDIDSKHFENYMNLILICAAEFERKVLGHTRAECEEGIRQLWEWVQKELVKFSTELNSSLKSLQKQPDWYTSDSLKILIDSAVVSLEDAIKEKFVATFEEHWNKTDITKSANVAEVLAQPSKITAAGMVSLTAFGAPLIITHPTQVFYFQ
jgi:hypothetical protein